MDKLKISYLKFGPTEFRLALIIINTLLIIFGTKHMVGGLKWVNGGAALGLCFLIYTTQKKIWRLDMDARRRDHPDWAASKPRFRAEIVREKSYVPAEECTY